MGRKRGGAIFDLKHKLLLAALLGALSVTGVAFASWLSAHDAMVKAEATVVAQKEAFDSAAKQIATLRDADEERAKQAAASIEAIRATASRAATPQQIADYLKQTISQPGAVPIAVTVPPPTATNQRPDATISQDSLAQLRDYTSTCEQCKIARVAADANVVSRDEQLKLAKEQLTSVQRERDAYRVAVRGTFWGKTKSALKYIVIGGAVGAVAMCGTGHCK